MNNWATTKNQIEKHLLIESKSRRLVKFVLNRAQRLYNKDRTNKDIILKARQEGFTSFILAMFLLDCLEIPNTRAVVISHEKEATQKLLRRVKMYVERFYDGNTVIKPSMEYENKNELLFRETNSTFYIGTAGARTFGRGDTIHDLLLTEYAFYENPETILAGVMQALTPDGRAIIETTANGYNQFRQLWYDSKSGKTPFKVHFFPWFIHEEYQIKGTLTDKTPEEVELQTRHSEITDRNLLWRREKIKDFSSDPRMFKQEYPSDDFEAFISTGNVVFNTSALEELMKTTKQPLYIGNVDIEGKFSTDPSGFIKIFKLPEQFKTYVIGGDVAEGLAKGDFSAGVVMDFQTAEVVASWHGHIDADKFGDHLVGLAKYYHFAVIGCEVNNHGLTTNIRMRDLGYENLYKRIHYDTITERETESFGWKTDLKTKPMMIGELKAMIRERQIPIPDESIINELLSFQEDEDNKLGAAVGAKDDLVIALAIALQMRKYTSPIMPVGNVPTNYKELLQPNQYANRPT